MVPFRLSQWFMSRSCSRGRSGDGEVFDRLAGLHQAQEMEGTVESADFACGGDGDDWMIGHFDGANEIAFRAELGEFGGPVQLGDGGGVVGGADDYGTVLQTIFCRGRGSAEHAV